MRRVIVATAFVLAAQACGSGSQLTPLGPVPTGTTVRLQEAHYTVRGATAGDLLTGMRTGGPGEAWYAFRWELLYGYQADAREGVGSQAHYAFQRCGVRNVTVTLTFVRTLPQWEPPANAPASLIQEWAEFQDAIRIHGEGHRDVALDAVREIYSRLRTFATEDCSILRQDVKRLVEGIVERHKGRDREYEEETERGRAQGVFWPRGAPTSPP